VAIRADKSQVAQFIVLAIAVNVIELQWYGLSKPKLEPAAGATSGK